MSSIVATKPLALQQGSSLQERIKGSGTLQELAAAYMKDDGIVVCWQRHRIIWGYWRDGHIVLSDGSQLQEIHVLEVRIFNDAEEIHLLRQGDTYVGRYIQDGMGQDTTYVDSWARLWGKAGKAAHGFVTLRDDERFLTMTIPCDEEDAYYGLVTRNYVTADEQTGQAGYSDYRFVRIEPMKGGVKS